MSGHIREEGLWIPTGDPGTVSEATPFAAGQLGKVSSFPNSNTSKQIQYVKRYATDTVACQLGGLAFWQDPSNFVVTSEPASAIGDTTAPLPAGVFLGTDPAAGEYGFIQVAGEATVRLADSTSAATAGNILVWNTNHQVRYVTAGTEVNQNVLPVVGVLKTVTTATGTNVSSSAVLTVPRNGW